MFGSCIKAVLYLWNIKTYNNGKQIKNTTRKTF